MLMTKQSLIKNALEKPSITLGNSIDGIFRLVFNPVLKYQIKSETTLINYKDQIRNNVSSIPKESLVEPPLNIVGPALEASKFYIDTDEIRNMFAKLISSSMDDRINKSAHPSFIEIIKQLSPLDAQTLTLFKSCHSHPIAKLRMIYESGAGIDYKLHLINDDCDNMDLISLSVSNLIRLGIVDVSYSNTFSNESVYSKLDNHPYLLGFEDELNALIASNELSDVIPNKPIIVRGIMTLTPLGQNFIRVCL